jgi:hypothetical protein
MTFTRISHLAAWSIMARHRKTLRLQVWVALMLLGASCSWSPAHAAGPQDGTSLPDVTFRTYQNETVRTGDMKGNVLFVELWATNCKTCAPMRASAERLNDQFAAKGVMFLSINEDAAQKTWEEYLVHKPSPLIEVRDTRHSFRRTVHVTSLPAALVVDRSGHVRWSSPWTSTSEAKTSEILARLLLEH